MADYTGSDRRLAYLFANGGGGGSCKVISGYYHDGSFYEDQSYTQIITGSEDSLYIDLDTTALYLFDGTDYVEVQGGGGGAVSDGTVGFRDSVVINSGASTTYDWSDVGLDKWGSYLISMTGENASGTGYTGVLARTAYIASSWAHSGLYSIRSSNISVSVNDSTEQITFTNTSSYDIGFVIEILPLHPKVEIPKHTYSTTEQVVGTWVDGKPIYECTFDLSASPVAMTYNSWVSTGITITGCSKIINAIGMSVVAANYPIIASYGSELRVMTQRNATGQKLAYITVQYTKSTT